MRQLLISLIKASGDRLL